MSRILAEVAGKLLTLLGYDGTDFRNIHVDAAGDLQVDVATSALPTGAATAAHQVTQTTALQLIDDLRTALNSVGTDELRVLAGVFGAAWKGIHVDVSGDPQVDVLSSALPTGAATAAHQVTLQATFQDQAFTYKGQIYERVTHVKVGAGDKVLTGAAVPADEIWVVSGVAAYNWNTGVSALFLGFDKAATQYWIAGTGALLARVAYNTYTSMYLVEDDKVACFFAGCVGGDNLALMYNGYKMTLAT